MGGQAEVRRNVAKGFIDDQPTAPGRQPPGCFDQVAGGVAGAVGVVGVDDDKDAGVAGRLLRQGGLDNVMSGVAPGARVFAVGRPDDADVGPGAEPGTTARRNR